MDLKYINESVLLFKIGKIKVPAYSLISLFIFLIFQNRFGFLIFLILFILSCILETKNENIKTIYYKFIYIFQKKFIFPSKNKFRNEK